MSAPSISAPSISAPSISAPHISAPPHRPTTKRATINTFIDAPSSRRDRGFTLVEILIAIVLVGILSAVVVVGVSNLTDKGSASACKASLDSSKTGSVVFYANTGAYPATFDAMVSTDPPALTLPPDVTRPTPLSIKGSGWTLTMTPVTGKLPTFVCS